MNKLGFVIKKASQGAGNAIECNKGQWINKVVDIREYLKLFNGLQGTDNIVTFISFDEGGCFLTQFRAISGRGGDFLSGWIFIPSNIEISGEDVINAYNFARGILTESNISEVKGRIESFFSKEYAQKEYNFKYQASKGSYFGVRYIGHYSLKEILGDNRYQPYYKDYKAIFLLDKSDEVKITNEALTAFNDITQLEIVETAVLMPPEDRDLQKLGSGTKILTVDGCVFKAPFLVNKGSKHDFILSREGFNNLRITITVTLDKQKIDLTKYKIEWSKSISSSMFTIRDGTGKKIEHGYHIKVNEKDLAYEPISISEDDCRQAVVTITSDDYETYEQTHNLLNGDCEIPLHRKLRTLRKKIKLANGELAEFTIESKNLPSNGNPLLEGYESQDGCLQLDPIYKWKQRFWGFAAAIIITMIAVASYAFNVWLDTHRFKFGLPPWEEIKSSPASHQDYSSNNEEQDSSDTIKTDSIVSSMVKAIQYLDGNDVWSKSEMEKYPELQGLFDDMNNFDLQRLLDNWKEKLDSSQNFKKISEAARTNFENNWNPKQGKCNPTYNRPNDERISLGNYIEWLSHDQTPRTDDINSSSFFNQIRQSAGHDKSRQENVGSRNEKNTSNKSKTTNGGLNE